MNVVLDIKVRGTMRLVFVQIRSTSCVISSSSLIFTISTKWTMLLRYSITISITIITYHQYYHHHLPSILPSPLTNSISIITTITVSLFPSSLTNYHHHYHHHLPSLLSLPSVSPPSLLQSSFSIINLL